MVQEHNEKSTRSEQLTIKKGCRIALIILLLSAGSIAPTPKVIAAQITPWPLVIKRSSEQRPDTQIDLLIKTAKEAEARGEIKTAEDAWEKAAAQSLGADQSSSIQTGYIYACLGYIKTLTGRLKEAEVAKAKAIHIYEEILGPQNPQTTYEYQGLGTIYYRLGEYGKAEDYYKRTLAARSLEKDKESRKLTIATLANLSSVYTQQGRLEKAKLGLEEVLAQLRLDRDIADLELQASSLLNLGNIYRRLNEPAKALKLYQDALLVASRISHDPNGIIAAIKEAIAAVEISNKEMQNPRQLLSETMSRLEKEGNTNTSIYAQSLRRVAYLESAEKHFEVANHLYLKALRIYNQFLYNRYDIGNTQLELALSEANQGLTASAYSHAMQGLQNIFDVAGKEAPFLETGERDDFMATFDETLQRVYTFARAGELGAKIAMTTRLNRQGLLEELELNEKLLSRLARNQPQIAQLKRISEQLASSKLTPDQRMAVRSLQEKLQTELFKDRATVRYQQVTSNEIAKALPADGVLIEFQRYQPMGSERMGDQDLGAPHYLALILKPDGSIKALQLGLAAPIDAAVLSALAASAEKQTDSNALWSKVNELVIKPLLPNLSGSRQWFISPDGELNRVSFAALGSPLLPANSDHRTVQLRQLTTGRELLRLQKSTGYGEKPVVVGNPDFEYANTNRQIDKNASNKLDSRQRSSGFDEIIYLPLPGTQIEAEQISRLLHVMAITGAAATKTRLQTLLSPRVLHLATHGFIATDSASAGTSTRARLSQEEVTAKNPTSKHQLATSIILAGANHSSTNPQDNGILTVQEAIELKLNGTELVVLSACSTAQGDFRTGEGVYGLQRSLAVAGARSTLLSLWKVDDAATQEFMTRFYTRLKAGEGRADALAAVQREFRNGIPGKPDDWKEPYYWAAWQLVGDWRPIKGL